MLTIDVHAHYIPEVFWEQGADKGFFTVDSTGLDQRVQLLNDTGIDTQVLSPAASFSNSDLNTSQRYNNGMAEAVSRYPKRFLGMATIALNDTDSAPGELERSIKELGLRGVTIGSNVRGVNLDAKEFGPFFAKAQQLDAPIFIHPMNVLGQERLGSYQLDNLIGNPTDTSVAAASLIFGGVLKEFPRLKVYLAHGGGTCPYLCPRWDQGWRARPSAKVNLDKLPSEYLKRFHFDSLTHSTWLLEVLIGLVGAERVMLGSDYPYDMGDREAMGKVESSRVLSEAEKRQIYGETAEAYFKIGA
jgi:aminocarboxymuconate-semialdehyde decarboxylase